MKTVRADAPTADASQPALGARTHLTSAQADGKPRVVVVVIACMQCLSLTLDVVVMWRGSPGSRGLGPRTSHAPARAHDSQLSAWELG